MFRGFGISPKAPSKLRLEARCYKYVQVPPKEVYRDFATQYVGTTGDVSILHYFWHNYGTVSSFYGLGGPRCKDWLRWDVEEQDGYLC